jgi:two-component system, chemotaxis family, CheB/CheR fusion protein
MTRKPRQRLTKTDGSGSAKPDKNAEKAGVRSEDVSVEFPVVALGASAGGLDSLSRFFNALPSNTGMAFVVVQHLSPTQDSLLSELLRKAANLSVVVAQDGQVLMPDHAYVIPPNRYLTLSGDRLRLAEPKGAEHPHMAIDHMLFSLAEQMGERSVAIILSGTGSDGAEGIKIVKGCGGLTIAQDPKTAQHTGMPESAIETQQVDFILSPEAMGEELVRYAQHRESTVDEQRDMPPEQQLQWLSPILGLLRQHSGHDFSHYKTNTLLRRIARRMAVHNIDDIAGYAQFLHDQPGEASLLAQEFLIRVTKFFRDPAAFKVLEEEVIPALYEGRAHEHPIRVWVPACSTGEEAYSIAMLLEERKSQTKSRSRIQVFATDIDLVALDVARTGYYPETIAQDVSPERLQRFFVKRDGGYQVSKSLRDMLVFAEQSLIKDPPFSRMDLVSCRNVLIYLQPELQKRVLALFHYALNPDGFLFLGTSETVSGMEEFFAPVRTDTRIFQRQVVIPSRSQRVFLSSLPDPLSGGRLVKDPVPNSEPLDLSRVIESVLLRDHTPPCVAVNARNEIVYFHGHTGNFLEPPKGMPTNDVIQMAQPGLESALRTALHQVHTRGETVHTGATKPGGGLIRITATPLQEPSLPSGMALILVQDVDSKLSQGGISYVATDLSPGAESEALQVELYQTKEALQATIEELETSNNELQTSNEELQSGNEELQSSNEELETSREELQSVNEELHTVNAELERKVEDLSRIDDDMNNLLASTAIGMIFLDRDLLIQRFTPAATSIVPLIQGDIGRPLADMSHNLEYDYLAEDLEDVLKNFVQREREVRTNQGEWFMLRMRPYYTSDHHIGGVLLAFVNITDTVKLRTQLKLYSALDHCPSMVCIVDSDGQIEYVNPRFSEITGLVYDSMRRRSFKDLGVASDNDDDWDARWRALTEGGTWSGAMQLTTRGGEVLTVSATAVGITPQEQGTSLIAFYLDPS